MLIILPFAAFAREMTVNVIMLKTSRKKEYLKTLMLVRKWSNVVTTKYEATRRVKSVVGRGNSQTQSQSPPALLYHNHVHNVTNMCVPSQADGKQPRLDIRWKWKWRRGRGREWG